MFESLANPLMKLVGLKTVEMAEEGKINTVVFDYDHFYPDVLFRPTRILCYLHLFNQYLNSEVLFEPVDNRQDIPMYIRFLNSMFTSPERAKNNVFLVTGLQEKREWS